MTRVMIHLEGIHKSFGERHILRGVEFEVIEGETICLIGGSGTGKSVSLKLIMRLLDPDKGRVFLDGEDITVATGDRLMAARSKLGVNFQFGALLKWLTVFENVALPLRENTRMKEPEVEKRVMQKLDLLRIPHARDLYPDQISGGMQKRAGLARAVVMEESVKVILYDEPTSGLDPISTAMVDDMVNEMRSRLGLTQIIVTHDMASAYRVADRIAVLYEGEVVQFGTPEEIQTSTHPYVVQFVQGLTTPPEDAATALAEEMERKLGLPHPRTAVTAAFNKRSSARIAEALLRESLPADSQASATAPSSAQAAASGSQASEAQASGSGSRGLASGSQGFDSGSRDSDLQDFEQALESDSDEGDPFASSPQDASASGEVPAALFSASSPATQSDVDPLEVGSEDGGFGSESDEDFLDDASVHSGGGQVLSLESEEQAPLPPVAPAPLPQAPAPDALPEHAGLLGEGHEGDPEDVFLISSDSNRLVLGDSESQRVPHFGETESGRLVLDEPGSSEELTASDDDYDSEDFGTQDYGPQDYEFDSGEFDSKDSTA
jgi:phospholipid/cholesterol/gamma-HCH transport system ATP-binding protein